MRYSSQVATLKLLVGDSRFETIRTAIDRLAAKMELAGYLPTDIRRLLREMLARFAGGDFAEHLFEFFVMGWCEEILKQAEEQCDRSVNSNSLGLFRMFVFGNDGGIENCRSKIRQFKLEELEELRRQYRLLCDER